MLGSHRLEARAAVQNGRGNGALRKIGAVREGVLRRSFLRNGEYLDQALWTILAEDWRDAKRSSGHRSSTEHPLTSVADMDVRDFDFDLPPELIAQEPPRERGASRLLHLDRAAGSLAHTAVSALPELLRAGDLLVVNNTRVFPGAAARPSRPERRRGRVSAGRSGTVARHGAGRRPIACQARVDLLGGADAPGAEIETGGAGGV